MDIPDKDVLRSLASANMAAVTCVYLIVFPTCIYILVGRRSPGQCIHWVLLAAVCFQFVVTTTMLIAQTSIMFKSFVGLADEPNALLQIVLYWTIGLTPLAKIFNVCSVINVVVGDAIMVWRVWILFHDRAFLVCLPPIITLIGSTSCGIAMVHEIWHGATQESVRHLAVSAWTLAMATQAYSTSLIAWEIWRRGVVTTSHSRSMSLYYKAIIVMIVESGALYTAIVLPLTITFAIGSMPASLVIAGLLELMTALTPASIVIRVALHRNRQYQTTVLSQVRPVLNNEKAMTTEETGIGRIPDLAKCLLAGRQVLHQPNSENKDGVDGPKRCVWTSKREYHTLFLLRTDLPTSLMIMFSGNIL
ncbi:hypothetical protein P691DRAFT_789110 [Macrolepiota fuliginosa MF-IS2]|uniref:Uncharacterized protein n=1 Tax=Macrolepiota fuliginosa MF-IS2 TaxID=1400762 RepID=A0A9P6BX62_9AGAR|nr:hypothetical protein P691DRAFT_789110 [Macrolepiota fuliginosa MF-IS2]